MFKNFRKITCILLALSIVFTFTACGNADTSSDDVEYVYEYEYVDGTQGDSSNNDSGDNDTVSKNPSNSKDDSSKKPSGNKDNSSKNPSGNKDDSSKKPSGNKDDGSKKPSSDSSGDALKKLRGTTVKYATWKDPALNEDGPVVESFQKKYGIKVEIVNIAQGSYASTIQGLIASGKSPDVYFCNGDFPNNLACLQPISTAKIDMNDSIWDQSTFNMTKFKGESYLCNTIGNIWNEVDCLFYNKSLWKQAGINSTPAEFDKAGKWNWDTLEQIMTSVGKLKNCVGGVLHTEPMVGSTGNGIFLYENGKFTSGLESSFYGDVVKKLATWKQNGLTSGSRDIFASGKAGIFVSNAYGLKRTGYLANAKWDDIGCYYIPDFDSNHKATETGIFRGWGIIRGAKNPEGAGVFLRYYLDVNNYDSSEAFINKEAETFFFQLTTGQQSKKNPYFTTGRFIDSISGVNSSTILSISDKSAPDQVVTKLATYKDSVAAGAKKINDFIDKNTGVK